ncbi:MAG: carboxynorspermidine decarboxylase, partial [Paramuribaculum sp.]|nr:carboxynorspermidine decarboxylase [Paramuribaculum sp.]
MTDEKTAIILGDNPPTPYYIVYEDRLRRNLRLINEVERESGANIIMAFKANALWRTFPIIAEYNRDFTASSLNELQLGTETLGGSAHSYCPAYTDDTIDRYLALSSHITFNSLSQAQRFAARAVAAGVSPGLRVNPACSVIETDIYNPALPGSRFGVTAEQLDAGELPAEIEGFHFHALCESTSYDLDRVLEAFEDQFGKYLPALKWVNMGGGHLMTREGYDTAHLIGLL